jgi:hypothetical protein
MARPDPKIGKMIARYPRLHRASNEPPDRSIPVASASINDIGVLAPKNPIMTKKHHVKPDADMIAPIQFMKCASGGPPLVESQVDPHVHALNHEIAKFTKNKITINIEISSVTSL